MKSLAHELKEENTQLKTKTINQEREIVKMGKIIEEFSNTGNAKNLGTKFQTETFFHQALKKQIKDLQNENKFKSLEIEKLKKNIKFTKF